MSDERLPVITDDEMWKLCRGAMTSWDFYERPVIDRRTFVDGKQGALIKMSDTTQQETEKLPGEEPMNFDIATALTSQGNAVVRFGSPGIFLTHFQGHDARRLGLNLMLAGTSALCENALFKSLYGIMLDNEKGEKEAPSEQDEAEAFNSAYNLYAQILVRMRDGNKEETIGQLEKTTEETY